MPYQIRSLDSLAQRARQYFTDAIAGTFVRLWPNTWRITGKVLALIDFENELRREWLARQMFASTADLDWLVRHGWELGLTLDPAAAATGSATGACTAGLAIPQGLVFQRADGALYSTRAAVTPTSTTVSLPLVAQDAGATGNTDAGDTLTLVPSNAAPSGLGTSFTIDTQTDGSGLSGGVDAETVEHFRGRVLERKRETPQGGSDPDYQKWALEALSTVTGVWVDSFQNDARSVWVAFTVSDQTNGIPSVGEVATVQGYLNDPVRRPVTARVFVSAPSPQTVNVTISGLTPDTPDTRAAIAAELAAVFAERVRPATPATPGAFTLERLWLDGAIDRAFGVTGATLTIPAADTVYSTAGQLPVLGTVSFI